MTFNKEFFRWRLGVDIEARDLHDVWFKAKIVKIDEVNKRIRVHFHGWNSRYDQWFDQDSNDIRLIDSRSTLATNTNKNNDLTHQSNLYLKESNEFPPQDAFKIGEKILSKWTDGIYYEASVMRHVKKNDMLYYHVIFFDGVKRLVRFDQTKRINDDTVLNKQTNENREILSEKKCREEPSSKRPKKLRINEQVSSKESDIDLVESETPISEPMIKCVYEKCLKTFRKKHLLDYHIKYHHYPGGKIIETPNKHRKEVIRSLEQKRIQQKDEQKQVEQNDPYEVINCKCKLNLAEGFMIQCENCFCWQHGECENISEINTPDRYKCWKCTNYSDKFQINALKDLSRLFIEHTQTHETLNKLAVKIEHEIYELNNQHDLTHEEFNKRLDKLEQEQEFLDQEQRNLEAKLKEIDDYHSLTTRKLP